MVSQNLTSTGEGNMSLRMDLAYVAIAALALMISDVTAARAATKPCDVMPWRCRYNSDARRYFYPPGHRMPEAAVTTPANTGAWGCGATDGVATGRSWGFPNQAAASYRALSECTKRSTHASCRIVSCSPSVHSYYEAHVAWFTDAHR
jgi:hypothetical protein